MRAVLVVVPLVFPQCAAQVVLVPDRGRPDAPHRRSVAEEVGPGDDGPLRGWGDALGLEDLPDGGRCDLGAEECEVRRGGGGIPRRVIGGEAEHQAADRGWLRGAPCTPWADYRPRSPARAATARREGGRRRGSLHGSGVPVQQSAAFSAPVGDSAVQAGGPGLQIFRETVPVGSEREKVGRRLAQELGVVRAL